MSLSLCSRILFRRVAYSFQLAILMVCVSAASAAADPILTVGFLDGLQNLGRFPSLHTFSFSIANDGANNILAIQRIVFEGPDARYYSVRSYPVTLSPHGGWDMTVDFDSEGQLGHFSAFLIIESNDSVNPRQIVNVSADVVADQKLLGLYLFDNPADPLRDSSAASANLLDGFDAGAANPVYLAHSGFQGGAYSFSGQQRLLAPLNIDPSVFPQLTMGAWVKTASLDSGLRKILGQEDGGFDRCIGLDTRTEPAGGSLADGTLRYCAYTGDLGLGPTQGDPPPVPQSTNDWSFVAAFYDQANEVVSLFVDLDSQSTEDEPLSFDFAANMGAGTKSVSIGSAGANGNAEGWQGLIDNVFFMAGPMDSATIRSIRDLGPQALLRYGPDPVISLSNSSPFSSMSVGAQPVEGEIEVKNNGLTQKLTLADLRITGADSNAYTVLSYPADLKPGQKASIIIGLDSGGREGKFAATLEVISNDGRNRSTTVDLSASVSFSTPPFRISGILQGAGILISWSSSPAQVYAVEYAEDLESPWTTLAEQTSVSEESTYKEIDPLRLARRSGFYRVRIVSR